MRIHVTFIDRVGITQEVLALHGGLSFNLDAVIAFAFYATVTGVVRTVDAPAVHAGFRAFFVVIRGHENQLAGVAIHVS